MILEKKNVDENKEIKIMLFKGGTSQMDVSIFAMAVSENETIEDDLLTSSKSIESIFREFSD